MITLIVICFGVWMLPKLIKEFRPRPKPQVLKHKFNDQDSLVLVQQDGQCLWVGLYSAKKDPSEPNWYRSLRNN